MIAESGIKVSVIVPIYNAAEYLRECVDSIVQQTYKNIEVILVDDGSSDNSGVICDEYAAKDERVKVFHNTNHGVSHARNCGIAAATGEYLCFVDSDDYVDKSFVEKMLKPLGKCDYDLVICKYFVINHGEKGIAYTRLKQCSENLKKDYWLIDALVGGPWVKFYKRTIIDDNKIKFIENLSYSEDRVFNTEYYTYVNNYSFVDVPLYYLVNRNPNSLSKAASITAFESAVYQLRLTHSFLKKNDYKNYQDVIYSLGMGIVMKFTPRSNGNYGYEIYKSKIRDIKDLIEAPITKRSIKSRIGFWLLKHDLYLAICLYMMLKRIF